MFLCGEKKLYAIKLTSIFFKKTISRKKNITIFAQLNKQSNEVQKNSSKIKR